MSKSTVPAAAALLPVLALLSFAVARADAPRPPSTEEQLVAHLGEAKWAAPKAPGFPAGVMGSAIAVDPASGASIAYAKFEPGLVLPAHWHSHTEYSTLLAGKGTLVVDGKSYDEAPGSYAVIPAKAQHQFTCAPGAECILLTRRAGPTDYHWVGKQ